MSWNGHRKISALATLALLLMLAVVLLGPMVTADVVDIVTAFAKGNWTWLLPFVVALFGAKMTWRGYRLNLETKRARTAAYVHGIGFPFEVYSSADLCTLGKALLGTDFDLPYVSRKPPGRQPEQTDRLLDGNLLLTGRAGIGKTREAIEIVRRMAAHKGEEVTVLVPTEIVDAPFSPPPTLNPHNIVLLINDVHLRYVASSQDEELPSPYRSFHERLAATVDYLNKRFVDSDIRLIFTATTKPDLHEVLKREAQFWSEHRFREYELWPLEKGALPKYVHSIAQHFRVELTEAAARRICNKSDGSCQGIVTALRKLPTGKELDVEQVRGRSFSCPQNWGEQIFNELTSGYPYRLAIFEAIAVLRRLGFAPFGFLVVDLAFAGKDGGHARKRRSAR